MGSVRTISVATCFSYALLQLVLSAFLWTSEATAETLRIARTGGPAGLGNPFTSVAQPSSGVWSLIFDSLTMFDESQKLQPGLALSWRATSDTTWEFVLRDGVEFHNGRPFTAAAAAKAIGLLLTEEARTYYISSNLQSLADVRIVDDLTIEIKTNAPDPILPQRLSQLMIVEPDAWSELGAVAFAQSPIGTGPYELKSWGRGNTKIELTAFEQSWRHAQDVTRVEMTVMPDAVSRSQALLSGVVDVVETASRSFAAQSRTDLRTFLYPTAQVSMLTYRLVGNEGSPLLDPRVREALTYTVNRRAIADVIYEGDVQPANQPITSEIVGFNEDLPPVPYDLDRAKTILDAAGYSDGFTLQAEFVNSATEESQQMLQLIAQDMARVGVKLTLKPTTIQNFFAQWQSGDWGDTDLFLALSDGSIFFDAVRPLRILSCDKPSPFVCNEALTQRLRAIEGDMDIPRRTARLKSLVADVVADHPAIWLTTNSNRLLATDRVHELPIRPQGIALEEAQVR